MKFHSAACLALLFVPSGAVWADNAAPARSVLEGCSGGACLSFVPELEMPSGTIAARPFRDRAPLRALRGDAAGSAQVSNGDAGPSGKVDGAASTSPKPEIEPGKVLLSSGHEVRVNPTGAEGAGMPSESTSWAIRKSDGTVRRMLHRWASSNGWQLTWEAQRDFPIETEFQIQGTFREAVGLVMESLAGSDFPVQASLNSHLRLIRVSKYLQGSAQ